VLFEKKKKHYKKIPLKFTHVDSSNAYFKLDYKIK